MVQGDLIEWAKEAVAKKWTVLHLPTSTVSTAKSFYDGKDACFVSPVNGVPVRAPVLELESGAAPLLIPGTWVALSSAEVRYFEVLQAGLSSIVMLAARHAAENGVGKEVGFEILLSVLRAQLASLGKG